MSQSTDDPILDWHRELAVEALQSLSWQYASAARLLSLGNIAAGVEAYRRGRDIDRDFLVADMRILRETIPVQVEQGSVAKPGQLAQVAEAVEDAA